MINRNIDRDISIDRHYRINYAKENGKKFFDQNTENIEEEFISTGKPIKKDNYFVNIFAEYQQAKINNCYC